MQSRKTAKQKPHKVVFLDRDGVINRDSPDYIKSWSEFDFLPGSLGALKRLTQKGFTIIVITNQSAVNRGMIPIKDLEFMHSNMRSAVNANGGKVYDIFFCPHTPDDHCSCRKPKPGLIHQAQSRYALDIKSAYMVGDSAKDVECARNAGCGYAILVQTGNGAEAETILTRKNILPDYVAADLDDAASWIIAHDPEHA
ncbi:MAG: D-glycero-beta-D-manno-heptose 1,7-bisphosphate 7-phosphatase [Desulfobacterales bacterium]|nr:D-glycero-beta-D-manno-heptose 1,7-bisphosphate 7-phosphatase [Desulfobacterales bacterium]